MRRRSPREAVLPGRAGLGTEGHVDCSALGRNPEPCRGFEPALGEPVSA